MSPYYVLIIMLQNDVVIYMSQYDVVIIMP